MTGLDESVKTKIVSCQSADSKPVKQEVNGTVILSPLDPCLSPPTPRVEKLSIGFFLLVKAFLGLRLRSFGEEYNV